MGLIENQDNKKRSKMANLYPTFLDSSNSKYLLLDNMFVTSLLISHYDKEMKGGFLEKLFNLGIDMQISIHYEKLSRPEVLKRITYQIGNTGANMKETNGNQIDSNIMNKTYEDAKYIKDKMQIDNEELYELSIYVSIYATSLPKLNSSLRRVETAINSMGLTSVRAYFKQEEAFLCTIPTMTENHFLKKITHRNVLTEGLCSTYPFLSSDLYDEDGVLIGTNIYNGALVMIDRFNTKKYSNANMFVLGTSGSGKSYFTKLMLIRNHYEHVTQFVVDPDREYIRVCKELKGTIIDFKENGINIMDIRECSKEGDGSFLENKIRKLQAFFSMVFQNMTKEEEGVLEEKLIVVYHQYGIDFKDSSLYQSNGTFKSTTEMPRLEDLYQMLKKDKKTKRLASMLQAYVSGSMRYLNTYTNVDLNNSMIVTDVFGIEEQDLPQVLFIVTEYYWDMIKKNRNEKKILYFDEAWKLMNQNRETAEFVFKLFKTIRKFGGAATVITQDVNDFFRLEEGKYGKGIVSNTSIKCIFGLEENELTYLEDVMRITPKEKNMISTLKRGECLLYAGRERVFMRVESAKLEHEFITTDKVE